MAWSQLTQLEELLKSSGLTVVNSLRAVADSSRVSSFSGKAFYTASDSGLQTAMHLVPNSYLSLSEQKRFCRRFVNEAVISAPCLITIGDEKTLGVYAQNSDEQDSFQQISLVAPSASEQDILKDIKKASRKQNSAYIVDGVQKALDYESLSKKFFIDAEIAKNKIENDIVKSMKISKNNDDLMLVASHFSIIVMARMIFIHFLEKKNLLNKEKDFIQLSIFGDEEEGIDPESNLWQDLFEPMFSVLSKPISDRKKSSPLAGYDFPYLNGGLFAQYEKMETLPSFKKLNISDESIREFHQNCLYKYRLSPSEEITDGDSRGVLDPELLGTMFEKFMKDDVAAKTGSVYTPKDVVLYIVRGALTKSLKNQGLSEKVAFELVHLKKISSLHAKKANKIVENLRTIDPCCGSGAFLLTVVQELFEITRELRKKMGKERWHNGDKRRAYEKILKNNIYGLDINEEAIILCHLRLWLPIIDLIDPTVNLTDIKPLPNLALNVRCGNAVTSSDESWKLESYENSNIKSAAKLRGEFFDCSNRDVKEIIKSFNKNSRLNKNSVTLSNAFADIIFGKSGGFDLVVGNPPYLGLKDTRKLEYLENYEKEISDLYIMVSKESYHLLKQQGIMSFVTSNSYFTDVSKKGFRDILLGLDEEFSVGSSTITELSNKTFKGVGVNPAIFTISKGSSDLRVVEFLSSNEKKQSVNAHLSSLNDDPTLFSMRGDQTTKHQFDEVSVEHIKHIPNQNLFIPGSAKIEFLENFGSKWKDLYNQYWPMIENSKKQSQNSEMLSNYRKSLKPYDLTLIGLVTEGGQGLATGCNAIHLAFLEGTVQAKKAKEKIAKAKKDIEHGNSSSKKILKGQKRIKEVSSNLKKNGHLYASAEWDFVYKTISKDQVLDVEKLNKDELEYIRYNGISKKIAQKYKTGSKLPTYVPYYKGQSGDDNRWRSKIENYIDWSETNVKWMGSVSGKKFSGAPVVRNSQFYFRKGFCWNRIRTFYLKSLQNDIGGVQDPNMLMLSSNNDIIKNSFLSSYLNQNNTASLFTLIGNGPMAQINDIKMLPIVIPPQSISQSISKEVLKIISEMSKMNGSDLDSARKNKIKKSEQNIEVMFEELYKEAARRMHKRAS